MRVERRAGEQLGQVGSGEAQWELFHRPLDDSSGGDEVDVGGRTTRQAVEDLRAGLGSGLDEDAVLTVGLVEFGQPQVESVSRLRSPADRRAPARRRRDPARDGHHEPVATSGCVLRVGVVGVEQDPVEDVDRPQLAVTGPDQGERTVGR